MKETVFFNGAIVGEGRRVECRVRATKTTIDLDPYAPPEFSDYDIKWTRQRPSDCRKMTTKCLRMVRRFDANCEGGSNGNYKRRLLPCRHNLIEDCG